MGIEELKIASKRLTSDRPAVDPLPSRRVRSNSPRIKMHGLAFRSNYHHLELDRRTIYQKRTSLSVAALAIGPERDRREFTCYSIVPIQL